MAINNVNNGNNARPQIDNQRVNQQQSANQNASQQVGTERRTQLESPNRQDSVSLTQSAQQLSQAQRRSTDAPVNQERVDRIRAAISNGEYRVDPERLAQNISRVEAELFGLDRR
ncbi:flagellar biosynthesis anti-sigma factor FlgM [Alteromonadaceae bacterium M269]|nr:flagellar biosynthesis anti-sigma factor FlgM [Alteromonadaceae bacterium M269]